MGRSGYSGCSPGHLLLFQSDTWRGHIHTSKFQLHSENKSLGHPSLRLETCHTSGNNDAETSATAAKEDKERRAVPRGKLSSGGGAAGLSSMGVSSGAEKQTGRYPETKSCPSLGEQKGIFPGGLVRNSRLCVLEKQGMVLLGRVCTDGRT